MILVLLFIGALFGLVASLGVLLLGQPWWVVLLAYSGVGGVTVLLLAVGLSLRSHLRPTHHDKPAGHYDRV